MWIGLVSVLCDRARIAGVSSGISTFGDQSNLQLSSDTQMTTSREHTNCSDRKCKRYPLGVISLPQISFHAVTFVSAKNEFKRHLVMVIKKTSWKLTLHWRRDSRPALETLNVESRFILREHRITVLRIDRETSGGARLAHSRDLRWYQDATLHKYCVYTTRTTTAGRWSWIGSIRAIGGVNERNELKMVVRKSEGYTLLFLEIFIIILNTLAIIVIQRFKKKYNPDILILTLAVADLIKAFIPLNMSLVAYLGGIAMTEGSPKCVIFGWTAFTVNSSIMLVMTIMAIDRYVAICWPFEYKHNLTKKRLIYAIIAVFVFSGVHSILPLVGVGRMRSYYNGSFCHFDFDSTVPASLGYSVFVLVLGISMLVVVIFCYTRAMLSIKGLIRRQRRMSASSRDVDGADRKRQSMNHMFARLMIVMMIAFCISWLLFLVS